MVGMLDFDCKASSGTRRTIRLLVCPDCSKTPCLSYCKVGMVESAYRQRMLRLEVGTPRAEAAVFGRLHLTLSLDNI
jgi:hypothetical protein